MKKKALGRGLGALIPDPAPAEPATTEIDIDRIVPNPSQPRLHMDPERLEELAASIRQNGVLQPVLVRPSGIGYQLIAGERRLTAAQRAGLFKIPAVVREVPDDRLLELALVENIQREQLNPIEEAQAYQSLAEELRLTQEELASRLGKERSTVANSVRLLKLPSPVKLLVAEGKLSPGHARALLAAGLSALELAKAAEQMVRQNWSVRDAERWAKNPKPAERNPKALDPDVAAASDRLRSLLGAKVDIRCAAGRNGAGDIRIHFSNQEDLIRIYAILTEKR